MDIKTDIRDLKKTLEDAEYYAAHLISDVVSNYLDELDPEKISEKESLKDAAINALNMIRYLKNGNREGGWTKPIIEKLTDLYEQAKKKDDENEN